MEDVETKKLGFDLEAVLKIESNDIDARSMRFVVGDRLAAHRYVQSPWNAHPNGHQPFASHAQTSLS